MPIKLWKYKIIALQNPTLKKLILYSMAEVLLVVLGILLALEVGNWKESKKIIIAENNTLIGLHEYLSQNLSKIQSIVRRDSLRIIRNQKIIDLLKDPYTNYQPQYDSLFGQILEFDVFFSQRLSYETIDNNGIVVIRNEQLRTKIAYLYNYALTELERQGNSSKQQLAMQSEPVLNRYLETGKKFGQKFPNDFQRLKQEQEFMNHLTNATAHQRMFMEYFKSNIPKIKRVMLDIEKELVSIKN
jgi:hypothetical protein